LCYSIRTLAPQHTIVVGGGLAGLACARELRTAFTLIESESRLGGLCRTESIAGFEFDWTGHWFHARDPEIRSLVENRWLAGNLITVERRAVIFSENAWTKFPYQHHLHGLPAATIAECIEAFVDATTGEAGRALRERPLANAADFIRRHLGLGFEKYFLRPYNEKLFTVPIEQLSPEWGGRFIPRPGLREVLRGALGMPAEGAGYNAHFWYPRTGGIESLVRAIEAEVRALPGEVKTSAPLRGIDLQKKEVQFAGGAASYDRLVLTLPLATAAKLVVDAPDRVREAAALLRSVSVTVVELGADDIGGEQFHWAYFPERKFPFYRVGSPSQVNPLLAPAGTRSFAVEFAHQGPSDHAALIDQSIRSLAACGLLDPDKVRVARARTIPTAYVLFDLNHAKARATVLEHFAEHGVQVAGRYGRWEYSSMEDALLTGRDAARAILGGAGT
jgi:protoporphyrinogen oxidase